MHVNATQVGQPAGEKDKSFLAVMQKIKQLEADARAARVTRILSRSKFEGHVGQH